MTRLTEHCVSPLPGEVLGRQIDDNDRILFMRPMILQTQFESVVPWFHPSWLSGVPFENIFTSLTCIETTVLEIVLMVINSFYIKTCLCHL